jgi:hypothetical protein
VFLLASAVVSITHADEGEDLDLELDDELDDEGLNGRQPAIPQAKSVHRCTPAEVMQLVYEVLGDPVGIDPCSNPRSIVKARRAVMLPEDGLSVPWHEYGTGYVNPPFGRVEEPRWVQKAIEEMALGWEGIMLLPAKTGAPWFEKIYKHSPCICFYGSPELDVEGRIWFHDEDAGATFNTEIIYFGHDYEKFARVFARAGQLVYPRHDQALTTRITGRTIPHVPFASGAATDDLFRHAIREMRAHVYHGFAVGVQNLPPGTTVRDVLERGDVPELRSLIEDLPLHDLGQALLLYSNEPEVIPAATTRRRRKTSARAVANETDRNQLGLPVYADGHAYRNRAERDRFDGQLLDTIRSAPEPIRRADITHGIECTDHEYRGAMKRLQDAGLIEKIGRGIHARYRAQPPRTEQDEQAQPDGDPAGPSQEQG